MNRTLISDFSKIAIEENTASRQLTNSSCVARANPWKGRVIASTNAEAIGDRQSPATSPPNDVTLKPSDEKFFEADAWPEPSAPFERRATVVSSGARTNDGRPKAKKLGRKWQNIEIDFASSRGSNSRGGGAINANHHPSSSMISSKTTSISRGGVGSNRRGRMSNGFFNRGRGGKLVNGYYQTPPPLQVPDQNVIQETSSDISETGSSAITTATSRATYSSRGRRNGRRGFSYTNVDYVPKDGVFSASHLNSSVSLAASQHDSVATVSANQVMPSMPPVGSVTYLFHNVVVPAPAVFPIPPQTIPSTTEAAVMDGSAASLQAAILLPQASFPPASTSPSAPNRSKEVITFDKLLEFLNECGWSKAQIPNHIKTNPAVSAAMQAAGVGDKATSEFPKGDTSGSAEKREDIIVVNGKIYIVPLNSHLTKFIKFHSKLDYVRHHVEHYFSENNLQRDEHLIKLICMNKHKCPIGALLGFNRLRYANTTENELVEAVMTSSTVGVVYDDQQRIVGVAPRNPSILQSAARSTFASAEQQSTHSSDWHQPKSSEVESSQVLLPTDSVSPRPSIPPNGATAPSFPGLQSNESHIFQNPQFMSYSGIPTWPCYYNTAPMPGVATGAAGDHAFAMNAGVVDNPNVYYRPFWPNHQPPASFIPCFASQHPPLYIPMLPPTAAGSIPHNGVPRATPAFSSASIAPSNAQLPIQQQQTFAPSVPAPRRSLDHQPLRQVEDKAVEKKTEQNS